MYKNKSLMQLENRLLEQQQQVIKAQYKQISKRVEIIEKAVADMDTRLNEMEKVATEIQHLIDVRKKTGVKVSYDELYGSGNYNASNNNKQQT